MEEEKNGCGFECSSCSGCGSQENQEEGFDGVLEFTDEEGNDVKFEILDVVALNDKEYLVVLPITEDVENETEEDGVVILEIKQEDGEEVYDTVVDEEEAEKVFNKFQEQMEELEELPEEE